MSLRNAVLAGALAAGGYLAYFYFKADRIKVPGTLEGKMKMAESLLEVHIKEMEAYLDELERSDPGPSDFGPHGKWFKRQEKIIKAYFRKINSLKLPCPSVMPGGADPGYVKWGEDFSRRENEFLAGFNKRYMAVVDRILQKTGGQRIAE